MRGKLVILEGGDGSGKTTFIKFLQKIHPYPEFYYTNEPGGNNYGMKIRHLLLNEDGAEASDNLTKFHLYWASKAENFRREIFPKLMAGIDVVSDRFEGSTFAYQVSEDPRLEDLFWQTRKVCFANIVPVYMNFDVSVEIATSRSKKRRASDTNYFDLKSIDYRNKVRRYYNRFFDNKAIKSYRIDASLSEVEMLDSAYIIFKKIIGF